MGKNRTLTLAEEFLTPNYGTIGLEIVSGKGIDVEVRYPDGRRQRCMDFLCGLGVTSLGHCHPAVVKAAIRQMKKLAHVSNLYATPPMAKLAAKLSELSGFGGQVFFSNSGTEANEAAAKLTRMRAYQNYIKMDKSRIIALRDSFHGRTYMSISLTGQDKMQKEFAPTVPRIDFVALNDIEGLRSAVGDDVCAVFFEVIQAEGGVNMMSQEYYDELYELSRRHHFLRVVDEVQTGVARTGKFFAHRYLARTSDTYPDIITMAKALAGGLPIGATIAKRHIAKSFRTGSHAATFGGNPVVCAAALAVIQTIERDQLLKNVENLGRYFLDRLESMQKSYPDKIKEVRGQGFMIGVELHQGYKAGGAVSRMRELGVLIGTAGNQVVRFLPPLIAEQRHIDEVLKYFDAVLQNL